MAMEFVVVNYVIERDVLIDGEIAGITNHMMTMASGTYVFSLDDPRDFVPRQRKVLVKGTSPLDPCEVNFVEVDLG